MLGRAGVGVAVLLVFILATRRSLKVSVTAMKRSWLAGVSHTLAAIGTFCSILYIDISLASFILFMYPLPVAIAAHFRGETPVTRPVLILMLLATVGLILVLGVDFSSIDLRRGGAGWTTYRTGFRDRPAAEHFRLVLHLDCRIDLLAGLSVLLCQCQYDRGRARLASQHVRARHDDLFCRAARRRNLKPAAMAWRDHCDFQLEPERGIPTVKKFAPARCLDNDRVIVHEKLSKICGVQGGAPKRRSRPRWDNRHRPPSNPNRALRGLGRQGPTCRSRSRLQRGQAETGVSTFRIKHTRLVDPCAIIGTWKRLLGQCRSEMLQPLWCPRDYTSAWIARLYRRYFRSCCNGGAQSHDIRAKL